MELSTYTPATVPCVLAGHMCSKMSENLAIKKTIETENDLIKQSFLILITKHFKNENRGKYDYTSITSKIESAKAFVSGMEKARSMDETD